jgi:glycosyltransferase involved in cell wall biosynthesis
MVTVPTAWPIASALPHRSLIFNRSDKQSAFPEVDQTFVRELEESLLREADLVLYVSHELMAEDADLIRGRSYFLDHGVDVAHFSPSGDGDAPDDIRHLADRQCIGFFGGFDDYIIDFELLEKVALSIPDAHLVLIGDATCSMEQVTRHPNVSWLGARDYQLIPAYGRRFDVALMPWLANDWIRYCNPVKLKEYLVLGLPIVSTRFPEVELYAESVDVADDDEDFIRLVKLALAAGRPVRRIDTTGWSWASKAHELLALSDQPKR